MKAVAIFNYEKEVTLYAIEWGAGNSIPSDVVKCYVARYQNGDNVNRYEFENALHEVSRRLYMKIRLHPSAKFEYQPRPVLHIVSRQFEARMKIWRIEHWGASSLLACWAVYGNSSSAEVSGWALREDTLDMFEVLAVDEFIKRPAPRYMIGQLRSAGLFAYLDDAAKAIEMIEGYLVEQGICLERIHDRVKADDSDDAE